MLKVIVQVCDVGVHCDLQQRNSLFSVHLVILRVQNQLEPAINAALTLFSHSNSAHICRNSASVQEAGWM